MEKSSGLYGCCGSGKKVGVHDQPLTQVGGFSMLTKPESPSLLALMELVAEAEAKESEKREKRE